MMNPSAEQVITELRRCAGRTKDQFFGAVVDAARDPSIHREIHASGSDSWCLLGDDVTPEVFEVAPYLVLFEEGAPLLETLVTNGWGDGWGVFFTARPPFDALLERLRWNMTAQLPEGDRVIFRYYDPRILGLYLQTCTAGELKTFFGPMTSVIAEGEDGTMYEYRRARHRMPYVRPWRHGLTQGPAEAAQPDSALELQVIRYPSGLCQLVR